MNKLLITEKGLAIIQSLLEPENTPPPRHTKPLQRTLPALRKEKIHKMHQAKNRDYQLVQKGVKTRCERVEMGKSVPYAKEEDGFWERWRQGTSSASVWSTKEKEGYSRYMERVHLKSGLKYPR